MSGMTNEVALYSQYPAAMFAIERVRLGETLTVACQSAGITTTAFRRIVAMDNAINELYAEAKANGDDILGDRLLTLHEEESDPRLVAILSKNIQWLLERRNKAYSPRIEHNHTHGADRDLIAALARGRERVMQVTHVIENAPPTDVEDASYTVVADDEDISQFL